MSSGWSMFVALVTLVSIAGISWLLVSNRNKIADGSELDHEFDGIKELDNPLPAWWVGMFVISIIFGLGYVAYYPALGNMKGASGWTSQKEWLARSDGHEQRFEPLFAQYAAMSVDELITNRKAMQTGRRLFLNYCSTCHGVAAKGGNAFPNLTDSEWLWGGSFETVKHTITNGRNGLMPAWESVLQPDQIADVTQYVLSLSGAEHEATKITAGKTSYESYCLACHGVNGEGNAALGAPNLSNDIWLYGGTAADISYSVTKGRGGLMPAKGPILGDDKIHLLSAYVLSLTAGDAQSVTKYSPASDVTNGGD
ncbi:MAG: cytochrome-c oxidase, cbb3-type subunit III [Gammaproteobacteria bacterium]